MPKTPALRATLGATALVALIGASMLPGCAGAPATTPSLYQRVGGIEAITAAVDDTFVIASADARINQRFGTGGGIAHLKSRLVELMCVRTGGPCKYTGQDMSAAHEGMYIRDDEFDALIEDLSKSLDKFKVPARERGELLAIFEQMRNAIVGH